MKTAGILPLTNKNWVSSARQGKMEEAIAKEARRRDQRKSSGLSSEAKWKNYLMIVNVQKETRRAERLRKKANQRLTSYGTYLYQLFQLTSDHSKLH